MPNALLSTGCRGYDARMNRFFLLAISVAVGACGAKQQPDPAPQPPDTAIELTASGLRPAPDVPVTAAVLHDTYPGYTIDGEANRFAVRWDGETMVLVDVNPDGTYRAKAVDPRVAGPEGISVGEVFERVRSRSEVECRRGMGEWVEQIYCTAEQLPGVTYAFELPVAETPECMENCKLSSLAPLENARIKFIDWVPQ